MPWIFWLRLPESVPPRSLPIAPSRRPHSFAVCTMRGIQTSTMTKLHHSHEVVRFETTFLDATKVGTIHTVAIEASRRPTPSSRRDSNEASSQAGELLARPSSAATRFIVAVEQTLRARQLGRCDALSAHLHISAHRTDRASQSLYSRVASVRMPRCPPGRSFGNGNHAG